MSAHIVCRISFGHTYESFLFKRFYLLFLSVCFFLIEKHCIHQRMAVGIMLIKPANFVLCNSFAHSWVPFKADFGVFAVLGLRAGFFQVNYPTFAFLLTESQVEVPEQMIFNVISFWIFLFTGGQEREMSYIGCSVMILYNM